MGGAREGKRCGREEGSDLNRINQCTLLKWEILSYSKPILYYTSALHTANCVRSTILIPHSMPAEVPDNQDSFQDSWRPVALGPPVFVPVHYTVQSDGLQGKSMDSLPNHSKSDSTSTPDSLSLCRVPSANSDRASNTSGDQRPSNGNAPRGQRPYSATAPRGQRPSSASAPGGHRPSSASTPVKRVSGPSPLANCPRGGGLTPCPRGVELLLPISSHHQ